MYCLFVYREDGKYGALLNGSIVQSQGNGSFSVGSAAFAAAAVFAGAGGYAIIIF